MHFLAKFGQYGHLIQLQKQGIVFCNTVKYFAELEDNGTRGDKHESAIEFWTPKNPKVLIRPAGSPYGDFKRLNVTWTQFVKKDLEPYGNLFCLYLVDLTNSERQGQIVVDDRNGGFGAHALVFLDTAKFKERLFKELDRQKLKFHFGPVEYVDLKNHTGPKSLFQKDIEFSYQQEFRIFIKNEIQDKLVIKIGDITDISEIYPFEDFKNLEYYRD